MFDIKNLCVTYGENTVLENVNLHADKGELIVVTGKSGSGKSSFLRCLNGIIPEIQEAKLEGEITFDDKSLFNDDISKRSEYISTVFQNPKTQFFCINTTEELVFALENRNIEREEIFKIVDEYTTLLNTKYLLDRNIFSLSGGQKQLVAITATACMDNNIYLFDEPSASLDKDSIELLKHALVKLKNAGKIIIVVEHRLYYLRDILDKLCIVQDKTLHTFEKEDLNPGVLENKIQGFNLRSMHEYTKKDLSNLKFIKINLINKNDCDPCFFETSPLQCKDLLFSYEKNKILDTNVSFENEINFIVGECGVGKTTFVRMLAGLSKGKGNSYYENNKIKKAYDYISMVMQDVNYQIFTESVIQEISIASNDEALKETVLKDLDLYDKQELHPQILSGGEKQRLLIGLAKVSKKPIVILDEPTSGLCKTQMTRIITYLHEMKESGKLVIVITHDYEFIHECGGVVYEFVRS